jgi:hypothetical protein
MYIAVISSIIIIHYTIAHRSFIAKLEDYFEQYKKTYEKIVSCNTMEKSKITKCELINLGFIHEYI